MYGSNDIIYLSTVLLAQLCTAFTIHELIGASKQVHLTSHPQKNAKYVCSTLPLPAVCLSKFISYTVT